MIDEYVIYEYIIFGVRNVWALIMFFDGEIGWSWLIFEELLEDLICRNCWI